MGESSTRTGQDRGRAQGRHREGGPHHLSGVLEGVLHLNRRRGWVGGSIQDRISGRREQQKAAMLRFRTEGPVKECELDAFLCPKSCVSLKKKKN